VAAAEHLRSRPEYGAAELAGLQRVGEEAAVLARRAASDWVKAESLPEGWSTKTTGQKVFFLAPSGQQLKGRRSTLLHLITEGEPADVVAEFRAELALDGWRTEELLPSGWLARAPGDGGAGHELQLLSREGTVLHGLKAALQLLRADTYTQQDVARLELLAARGAVRRRVSRAGWVGGENLPEGWRTKMTGTKAFFLDPQGRQFKGRLNTLRMLLDVDYPGDVVERFLDDFSLDGWREDALLPSRRWRARRLERGHNYQFLTPEGHVLKVRILLLSPSFSSYH
jgi:hypothetical protein